MRIAVLGGSFDPPHNGHIAIAHRLLKLKLFDEIWLMPCYRHPFNKKLSADKRRLAMTKYLEEKNIRVSDLEIKSRSICYTVDTLALLNQKYPKDRFSWIIGTDQLKDFPKWKKWKKIIDNFELIIVPRFFSKKTEKELKNIKSQVTNPKNIILIDKKNFSPINISSTLIRKKLNENKSISKLVPKKVEEYIIQNRLYK